jgi:hypothetical protein
MVVKHQKRKEKDIYLNLMVEYIGLKHWSFMWFWVKEWTFALALRILQNFVEFYNFKLAKLT